MTSPPAPHFAHDLPLPASLPALLRSIGPQEVAQRLEYWSTQSIESADNGGFVRWLQAQLPAAVEAGTQPVVLGALLSAAGENGASQSYGVLAALAHSSSRAVRLEVAKNLPFCFRRGEGRGAVDLMARLASDPSPEVRDWAVFGLAEQMYCFRKRRLDLVEAATRDHSVRVRATARRGLARFAWSSTGDPVRNLLVRYAKSGALRL